MSTSVVPRVDSPPVFEAGEHVLDLVALAIEYGVIAVLNAMFGMRRNAGRYAARDERLTESRGTVSPISKALARGKSSTTAAAVL